MKGSFEIKISRKRGTRYGFTVNRNITIIRGDSGSGKTTLYEMVSDHMRHGEQSGVSIQCDCPCVALTDTNWQTQLASFSNSIVFIDEGFEALLSHEFATAVKKSTNYFVIITRADLPSLPYSVSEIYQVKTSGKFHSLVPFYTERERYRYSSSKALPKNDFEVLLTEDSKSGFQFFSQRFAGTNLECENAGSNAGVLNWLAEHAKSNVFVVADGAAFGPFADRVLKLQAAHRDSITICLPESFEWLLLKSGIIKSPEIERTLENPSEYIDSAHYMSWEQFFTHFLKEQTKGTPFEYKKSELAEPYSILQNASKVMALIACRNIK